MRPVVDLSSADYMAVCMDTLANQASKISYITGGQSSVPLVVRASIGSQLGRGAQQAQSLHAWLVHSPGMQVVMPSTPHDAKGLMNTALVQNGPVLFVENKLLYSRRGDVPEERYFVEFGRAAVVTEGRDLTIVATSSLVAEAVAVAEALRGDGVTVEVIDPRTIVPLDQDTILRSVEKTGRAIVADEGYEACGVASEIITVIATGLPDRALRLARVTAPNTPVPYSKPLHELHAPRRQHIEAIARHLLGMSEPIGVPA